MTLAFPAMCDMFVDHVSDIDHGVFMASLILGCTQIPHNNKKQL